MKTVEQEYSKINSLRETFEGKLFVSKILNNGKVWWCDSVRGYSGQGNDYFLINGAWYFFKEENENENY